METVMPETPLFDKAALAWSLPWDTTWVTAVTFIGPSRKLAAANNFGEIFLWELPEKPGGPAPAPVRRLDGHTNTITALASTPDGRRLISASYDHSVRVWDLEAATEKKEVVVLDPTARAAAQKARKKLPEGPPITVGIQKAERVVEVHKEWVRSLALSQDGKRLLTGDDRGVAILWEAPGMKEVRRLQVPGWIRAAALSPDAGLAAICETCPRIPADPKAPNAMRIWELAKGTVKFDMSKEFLGMYSRPLNLGAVTFADNGKLLALGQNDEAAARKVYLASPATGKKVRELVYTTQGNSGITGLVTHPDGKHLASCGRDTMVRIWNLADGKMVKEIGKTRGAGAFTGSSWFHAISFSTDGLWLAAADMGGLVQVWSIPPAKTAAAS
jgi:WD40 repeat protein